MKLVLLILVVMALLVLVAGCYNDAGWYIPQVPQGG
jgi:predicted small secreted protein